MLMFLADIPDPLNALYWRIRLVWYAWSTRGNSLYACVL